MDQRVMSGGIASMENMMIRNDRICPQRGNVAICETSAGINQNFIAPANTRPMAISSSKLRLLSLLGSMNSLHMTI
jgi:hypothetical protein